MVFITLKLSLWLLNRLINSISLKSNFTFSLYPPAISKAATRTKIPLFTGAYRLSEYRMGETSFNAIPRLKTFLKGEKITPLASLIIGGEQIYFAVFFHIFTILL